MNLEKYPFSVNENGHLDIDGADAVELAKKYGTPLYVYNVSQIRKNCQAFVEAFKQLDVKFQVAYASKAFSSIAIIQVIEEEGLSIDVVSEGELYTALQAGFPPERIHFHGNNKSIGELTMAIEHQIGCIIVDNFSEIQLLNELLQKYETTMDVLIRVTPGISSKTHEYIMTGNEDSKFGFNIHNGQAEKAFQSLQKSQHIHFKGLHIHIGSQIFETDNFVKATDRLFKEISRWYSAYGYIPDVLNLGGGFPIRYTDNDEPLPLRNYVEKLVHKVKAHVQKLNIPMPELWIEPGRSIVGDAGLTLYTVGTMKQIPGVRDYVAVDGGMTDNLRPALYQAKYTGLLANKANAPITNHPSIAGKCCESGDMLVWNLPLATVESGDILAILSTGAYGYSMANHYNRFPKPAVVFVENGEDKLVIRRETYEDVVRNDLPYR
ncbi:MAG TPA: diaminopimelate decarboxylase [Bacillota bacterium]